MPDSVPLLLPLELKPVVLLAPIRLGLVYAKAWSPAAQGASPVFCSVCHRPSKTLLRPLTTHACTYAEAGEQYACIALQLQG